MGSRTELENLDGDAKGKGASGANTAATVDGVFAAGRTMACLYSDLRNKASNRCYAKIGFKPVCRSAAAFVLSWPRPQN